VGAWRVQHDWAARLGVPAHVTVMGPFLKPARVEADVCRRLAWIFERTQEPLAFSLSRLERRGDVAFLLATPDRPFERLSTAIHEEWPQLRPYGHAFDRVRFHLTVARGCDDSLFASLSRAINRQLPLSGTASEAMLVIQTSGDTLSLARFDLGVGGVQQSARHGSQMGSGIP
jgi:hypothetical protein